MSSLSGPGLGDASLIGLLLILALAVALTIFLTRSEEGPKRLTPVERDGDEPALSEDGAWATYLTSDGQSDEIWLHPLEGEGASLVVSGAPGPRHLPAVATIGGRPIVVWTAFEAGRWDLWWRPPTAAAHERLTDTPSPDRAPILTVLPRDRVVLTWIGPDPAQPSGPVGVLTQAWSEGDGWSATEIVPESRGAWRAATACDPEGNLWIAWDSYRGVATGYDISLARRNAAGRWLGPWLVAASDHFESFPDVAADGSAVWIAWQEGSASWGLEGSTNLKDVALHDRREVRLAKVDAEGVLTPHRIPAALRALSEAGNLELPRLALSSNGDLLVVARTMRDVADNTKRYRFVAWQTLAAAEDTEVAIAIGPPGRNDQLPSVSAVGSEFVAQAGDDRSAETAFQADRPPSWFHPATGEHANYVVMQRVEGEGAPLATGPGRRLEPSAAPSPRPLPREIVFAGESYRRTWGDLHRHSDLSRCSANLDGTIEDCYRYAYGPGELDFVALTDHSAHLTRYDWWRVRKAADLYQIPGRDIALFGYERSSLVFGHRNILSPERDLPLISWKKLARPGRDDATAPTPKELFALLENSRGRAITIPHSPGGQSQNDPFGIDWNYHDPELERLVEIFQSYRGSYEGRDAPRLFEAATRPDRFVEEGLGRGYRLGFIASSDHQSSGGAFAVAYTRGEPTRQSVFEALYARRCYAATAKIGLMFQANGEHWMGSVVETNESPVLRARIEATSPLEKVEILGPKGIEHSPPIPPGSKELELEWSPPPVSEETYYYVRVVQTDDEMAWSSPIWFRPVE